MPEPKTNQTPDQKTGYEDKPTDELKTLLESETDVEKLKGINRELFGRAKRAEDALKAGGGKKDPAENGGNAGQPAAADKVSISYEDGLALQAEGLSPTEILEMAKIAKRMGVSPVEAYKDPIIKAGFESTRKKDRVASQTLPPSGRVSGRSAERSKENPNDTPGTAAARAAFNRGLAQPEGGEE